MMLDASLWKEAGFLMVDAVIFSWFSSAFTAQDAAELKKTLGNSEYQLIAEALAVLTAVRTWTRHCAELAVQDEIVER